MVLGEQNQRPLVNVRFPPKAAINGRSRMNLDASPERQHELAVAVLSVDVDPVAEGDLTVLPDIFGHERPASCDPFGASSL